MKANGHDAGAGKVNGHGQASPPHPAQEMEAPLENSRAASDDARDFPSAAAATSAVAGKERDACAEVARLKAGEENAGVEEKRHAGTGTPRGPSEKDKNDVVDIPPGSEPLPMDGPGFVDAMHTRVDLYLACARLVKSKDEKIAQRMVERLLEMSYGKSPAAVGDEVPQQIVFDIDSAVARRAAEGAGK